MGAVVVLDAEVVKLEDEGAVVGEAFVLVAAVGALAAEELLIPAAAAGDVGDGEERLGAHGSTIVQRGSARREVRPEVVSP